MSVREEFEAWLNGEIEETVGSREAWHGGYHACELAMRERASSGERVNGANILGDDAPHIVVEKLLAAIRALDVDADDLRSR